MQKKIRWDVVKAEFMRGDDTLRIAKKHQMNHRNLMNTIAAEKWRAEKDAIEEANAIEMRTANLEKIKKLGMEAVDILAGIMNDTEQMARDRVAAAKEIVAIAGLKNENVINEVKLNVNVLHVVKQAIDEAVEFRENLVDGRISGMAKIPSHRMIEAKFDNSEVIDV